MLVDSNIIIYAAQPEYTALRDLIAKYEPAVSAISYVEVLGYHQLTETDREHFAAFFAVATILPLAGAVLDQAVALRQQKKMTLGDALTAGTALVFDRTLVTRNTADFEWISGIKLLNPFDEQLG